MTALLRFFNDIVAKYLRQDRELTHDIDVRYYVILTSLRFIRKSIKVITSKRSSKNKATTMTKFV